jgi:hypothetical protein
MREQGFLICARCHGRIEPGDEWDEGHDDDDRSKWVGPEHSRRCNRRAASIKSAERWL